MKVLLVKIVRREERRYLSFRYVPVKEGKRYNIEINTIGSFGDGIGRIEDFAIFVPNTVPGDMVLIEAVEVKKNYARGRLIEVLQPSVDRVESICHVFPSCGGCQLMHVRYEAQLRLKEQLVRDAIERISKLEDVIIHPIIGMSSPENYRNKAQFPIRLKNGKVDMGFFVPNTHDLVDIQECHIQHPLINKVFKDIKDIMNTMNISVYDENNHRGLLRHVAIKVSTSREEAMVILVTNGHEFEEGKEIARQLMDRIPQVVSVVQNINKARTNVIFGPQTFVIRGKSSIEEEIKGLRFRISPLSFFQVNTLQVGVLYSKALEYANLTGSEVVIDAYCGIGTISLFLSKRCKEVYGIEEVPEAIAMARENADLNQVHNTSFFIGQVEKVLPSLYNKGLRPDVIVIDPPRKGCTREVIETIATMEPQRIVYISCNPSTLARDIAYFKELNYITEQIQPVDMFPFTSHVECIALIQREIM